MTALLELDTAELDTADLVAAFDAECLLQAVVDVLEAPPPMSPSEFAETHRWLKPGTTFRDGLWSNAVFPYLTHIMDLVQEAIEEGKRGLVLMKSAQGGGSEGMINALCWLLVYYPGPILYLISKDEIATEFSRDRFDHINKTCEPIAKKHLSGWGSGDSIHTKRYTDAKLKIAGGQSVLNIESLPYPWVFIDEPDSLPTDVKDKGDPLKVAELRTEAWQGQTLMIAFSHPTTRLRGTGKIYYGQSDQRRGFVSCPHCPGEFWLDPEQIKVLPREGQGASAAERDPTCYHFVTPCCGVILTDSERFAAVAAGVTQKSTLPPEVAETKDWIGAHFSQLYMANKPMRQLAVEVIQGLDEESTKVVVVNKRWGDTYDGDLQATPAEAWEALACHEESPWHYTKGNVPPEVLFLTGGQDSRLLELHWSVWGWGIVRAEGGHPVLCNWLVDYGVQPGPAATNRKRTQLDSADLSPLTQVLYEQFWPVMGTDNLHLPLTQCAHDSGWQPTAVYEYCALHQPKAVPTKGAALDDRSKAPLLAWSAPPRWRVGKHEYSDPNMRLANLNTYQAKLDIHGMAQRRFVDEQGRERSRMHLPGDVSSEFVSHLASEQLQREGRAMTWKKKGPNHWLDTLVGAHVLAHQVGALAGNKTRAEAQREANEAKRSIPRKKARKRKIRTRY